MPKTGGLATKSSSDSCLTCKFHGPPVSDFAGARPCAACISHAGFPKWEPAAQPLMLQAPVLPKVVDDEFLDKLTTAGCRAMGIPQRYYRNREIERCS